MKKNKKNLILFAVVLVALLFAGYKILLQGILLQPNTVVLKEDGYYPAGLKIEKGTTVTFKTELDEQYWPASDIHPTHELYSEFDPKRSLQPGEEWQFTFERSGTWRLHDHINPQYRATIEVVEKGALLGSSKDREFVLKDCGQKEMEVERNKCYINYFQNLVLNEGVEEALEVLKSLREESPEVAIHCHTFVHSIGEVGYWKYVEDGELPGTGKTALCGYGFLHGFMQEIGHHDINFIENAKDICNFYINEVDYTGYEETVDPVDQCYHGIGHGVAFLYAPDYWEDEESIIKKGSEACSILTKDEVEQSNCIYGLFGGLTGLYTGGHGFKMDMDQEDPLGICRTQPEDLKGACYDSMVPALWVYVERNVDEMISYFKNLNETEVGYLEQAMYNFGDIMSPRFVINELSKEKALATCHSMGSVLSRRCIEGFSEGLIRNGFPETAPTDAREFCNLAGLNAEEKDACYGAFLSEMKLAYSKSRLKEVCDVIDDEYQKHCE